jgi:hypothetical protein
MQSLLAAKGPFFQASIIIPGFSRKNKRRRAAVFGKGRVHKECSLAENGKPLAVLLTQRCGAPCERQNSAREPLPYFFRPSE